jgi:hypothetical protein
MRSLLVIVTTVALLGAACGESGGPPDGGRTDAPPAERDEPEAISLDERPATREEVRWVGRLIDWVFSMEQSLEVVAGITSATENATPDGEDRRRLEDALAAIGACERLFGERVGAPPSERLTVVESNVEGACEHFEAGAEAAKRLLKGDGDADALSAEWEDEWTTASEEMRSVARQIGDYQPGNARDLPVRGGVTGASRVEPAFSRVGSDLIERSVEVRCWSERDWPTLVREASRFSNGRIPPGTPGFVTGFEDSRVNLHPDVCESLVALRYQGMRPRGAAAEPAIALAVGTFSHELQHVRGVVTEAAAECWGMQMIREAARGLGAPLGYSGQLARTYWNEVHPLLPPAYRSPDCYDGGPLDSNPGNATWP